jgi:protein-S-isoprenylcysteine O-methyltransferase Ste14
MTRSDLRAYAFRYRSYTPIPFLIIMVLFARPTIVTLSVGAAIAVLGEALRFWGVAIAGSETRTTGTVGGTYLITTGPFAFVRNPLYVGNMFLYAGVGIMSNALFPWLIVVAVVWFYVQYSLIVSGEEEYLAGRFGSDYEDYCARVPRFIPRLTPYRGNRPADKVFSMKEGLASEKRTLQAITLVTVLIVARLFVANNYGW